MRLMGWHPGTLQQFVHWTLQTSIDSPTPELWGHFDRTFSGELAMMPLTFGHQNEVKVQRWVASQLKFVITILQTVVCKTHNAQTCMHTLDLHVHKIRHIEWCERERQGRGCREGMVYPVYLWGELWARHYSSNTGLSSLSWDASPLYLVYLLSPLITVGRRDATHAHTWRNLFS